MNVFKILIQERERALNSEFRQARVAVFLLKCRLSGCILTNVAIVVVDSLKFIADIIYVDDGV